MAAYRQRQTHRQTDRQTDGLITILRPGRGAEYCDQSVCLSVCVCVCLCLYATISLEPLDRCEPKTACRCLLDSLRRFSQRRSRTQVLCARCVPCDVSSDRIPMFTFCVMRHDSAKRHIWGGGCAPRRGL